MALKKINELGAKLLGEMHPSRSQKEIKRTREFLDFPMLGDLFTYESYENGLFHNEDSLGFILSCTPFLSSSEYDESHLTDLFEKIPEGAGVQFLFVADPRVDTVVNPWEEKTIPNEPVYKKIFKERADLFRNLVIDQDVKSAKLFRLYISYTEPQNASEKYEKTKQIRKILEMQKKMISALSDLSHAQVVNEDSFLEMMDLLVNFEFSSKAPSRSYDPEYPLSRQIAKSDVAIEVDPDSLLFEKGKNKAQFTTLIGNEFPKKLSIFFFGSLFGHVHSSFEALGDIPVPFFLHFAFCNPKSSLLDLKKRLEFKISMRERMSRFFKFFEKSPSFKEEFDECIPLRFAFEKGAKAFFGQLSCGFWSPPEKHSQIQEKVEESFKFAGFKLFSPKYRQLPQYLSCLPMSWHGGNRSLASFLRWSRMTRTTLSSEIGHMLPAQGEWSGNSDRGMLLQGRGGQLCCWDPFARKQSGVDRTTRKEIVNNQVSSFSAVVVGRVGSGKSVFMQDILMNTLRTGGKVFVLDAGRSFEKMCKLVGGEYIDFGNQLEPFDLSPFNFLDPSDVRDQEQALTFGMVRSLFFDMIDSKNSLTTLDESILSTAIVAVWNRKGQEAKINDVFEFLQNKQSFVGPGFSEPHKKRAQDLALMMKDYIVSEEKNFKGLWSHYFSGTKKISFKKQMSVVELEEIRDQPQLKSIVLQSFALAIANEIFHSDRTKPSIVCIDEASEMLSGGRMETFIGHLARRLRKYNASLIVGTQMLSDFTTSPGARAAFSNAYWKCFLEQNWDGVASGGENTPMEVNPGMLDVLRSVRSRKGKYSEILIQDGQGFFEILRHRLDPYSLALYESEGAASRKLTELIHSGISLVDALEQVVTAKKRGEF